MAKLTSKEGCKGLEEQYSRVETFMRENTETIRGMAGEGSSGQMELITTGCGRME